MRLLVVDDNGPYAEMLRALLARNGYAVAVAASGAEALDAVRREAPSLVLMDLYMAGGDGDDVCRRLKADPESGGMPVLMMSAGGRKTEAERCVEAGCDEFLVKPIRQAELLLAVSRHLHGGVKAVRVDLRVPVAFETGGERLGATSVNLSLGGMFVESARLYAPGTEMLLDFTLPADQPLGVLVRAKVAWLNRPEAQIKRDLPIGMGVEFTKMAPEAQNALGLFLCSRAAALGAAAGPA